jgi:hypothetical protein
VLAHLCNPCIACSHQPTSTGYVGYAQLHCAERSEEGVLLSARLPQLYLSVCACSFRLWSRLSPSWLTLGLFSYECVLSCTTFQHSTLRMCGTAALVFEKWWRAEVHLPTVCAKMNYRETVVPNTSDSLSVRAKVSSLCCLRSFDGDPSNRLSPSC